MSSASSTPSFFSEDGAAGAGGLGADPDPKKEANVLVAPEAEAETVGAAAGLSALNGETEDVGVVNAKDPGPPEKLELEVVDPNPPNLGTDATGGICRVVCNQIK